jgi:ADP-ribosylglycohydrolase
MSERSIQNKITGSLLGGAMGDAFGCATEFSSYEQIVAQYGPDGVTRYELLDGKARFSDDTQMSLFTANGLLNAVTAGKVRGVMRWPTSYIRDAYIEWFKTQHCKFGEITNSKCWICDIPELYALRAPGNTCLGALRNLMNYKKVANDSKGCGGIMRVSPIAMLGASQKFDLADVTLLASDSARLTHLHPMGFLPSGLMAYVLYQLLLLDGQPSFDWMEMAITDGCKQLSTLKNDGERYDYHDLYANNIAELLSRSLSALDMADRGIPNLEAINQLGGGWTGDEAWYIALFCTMRHLDSFSDALCAAVNHSGDSDSTGAVCGNLIGAIVGYGNIPNHFKQDLEIRETLESMAEDLSSGCMLDSRREPVTAEEKRWTSRYCR